MKPLMVILIPVLVLALAGAGIRLWQQQREIDFLKAEAATAVTDAARRMEERDALEKRVREASDETVALRAEIAALHKEPVNVPEASSSAPEKTAAKKPGGMPTDAGQVSADTLRLWLADANDPSVLRRLNLQARNRVLQRYGDLFKQLNLTPEQTDQFTKLLTDKRQVTMDVAVTGYQHGEDPAADMDNYREQVIASRTSIENQINALLGDTNASLPAA